MDDDLDIARLLQRLSISWMIRRYVTYKMCLHSSPSTKQPHHNVFFATMKQYRITKKTCFKNYVDYAVQLLRTMDYLL